MEDFYLVDGAHLDWEGILLVAYVLSPVVI